jgi:hypothetical protein
VAGRRLKGRVRLADVAHDYRAAHDVVPMFAQAAAGNTGSARRL